MNTQEARAEYIQNGYEAIPLKPQSKLPAARAWETKPTIAQWHNAPADSNIGLRAGHGKAFLDLDDKNKPGTSAAVARWMEGRGYHAGDYPTVRTPNNGTHIYVNFTDTDKLLGSKRLFSSGDLAGDFRYNSGAFVGAYPSVIEAGAYVLVSGNIARLPELDLKDISELIDINAPAPQATKKSMSRLALVIANGTKPDKYASASEGEAGLILSLINKGYSYEEIKHVFNTYPCLGHYSQKHAAKSSREGERWLYRTYSEMLQYSQHESPARRMIAELLQQAKAAPWKNANRKKVYLAHLETAHKAGKPEYSIDSRTLALTARLNRQTAMNQTAKLIGVDHLLAIAQAGSVVSATTYRLTGNVVPLPKNTLCEEVVQVFHEGNRLSSHDAFRNGGGKYAKGRLGRRAGEVYELIFNNPLTIEQITETTGASSKTVIAALKKMKKVVDYRTGELIEMVTYNSADNSWIGNLVDLDIVAGMIKTLGATGKQRLDYEEERRKHTRDLELGTIKAAQ